LKLGISLEADISSIDAQRGGECTILCQVTAYYPTAPPSTGFDGVILLDISLRGHKSALATDVVDTLVELTSSNDRLGFVVFGTGQTGVVSELIMCTAPFKLALRKSLSGVSAPGVGIKEFSDGMELALGLLANNSRGSGQVFVISDGWHGVYDVPMWENTSTIIQVIGVGAFTDAATLCRIRHNGGSFIEFRNREGDLASLGPKLMALAMSLRPKGIDTVRCRVTYPSDVDIDDILNHQNWDPESKGQISLTIRMPRARSNPSSQKLLPK
jgi:hypothetical protein